MPEPTPLPEARERRGQRRRSAVATRARFVDESTRPDMPALYRRHLRTSRTADIALTRLRILGLRLNAADVAQLPRIRLCVAHPRAAEWEVEVHRSLLDPSRAAPVRGLISALAQGRITVRAAPLGGWSPDFTVFGRDSGPRRALVGSHWLERPHPERGPVIGVELAGAGARALSRRFDDVWESAYEVTPALAGLLGRAIDHTRGRPVEPIDTPEIPR